MESIKSKIGEGNIEEAIHDLLKLKGNNSGIEKELYLFYSNYSNLKRDKVLGVISRDEYQLQYNKVAFGVLELIDKIPADIEQNEVPKIKKNHSNRLIMNGVDNYSIVSYEEAFAGHLHTLNKPNYIYPNFINCNVGQVGLEFHADFESKYKISLYPEFKNGYDDDGFEAKDNYYFFTQWDIDLDGVDEIVLGLVSVQDKYFYNLDLVFIKFYSPFFLPDVMRRENWKNLVSISLDGLNTIPKIYFRNNVVTVVYHFRGFYNEYHFVRDKFVKVEM